MGNIKEKKIGAAGLQPTPISLDFSKLLNLMRITFLI